MPEHLSYLVSPSPRNSSIYLSVQRGIVPDNIVKVNNERSDSQRRGPVQTP